MKKISMVLAMMMVLSSMAFADPASMGSVRDAGNKICPVSGEAVSGSSFVEHAGVRYGLCCSACAKKFQANPEKYLAQMAQSGGSSETMDMGADHADHTM